MLLLVFGDFVTHDRKEMVLQAWQLVTEFFQLIKRNFTNRRMFQCNG